MEDRVNDLLDKLMLVHLEKVLDLLEDEDNDEDAEVYEAAKKLFVYFGGELDEY
jgi:hypothetical protein